MRLHLFNTAIIIAGGKSVRMGFDKAFMTINGVPCIKLLIKKLKRHFDEIIIVTNDEKKYKFLGEKITSDEFKNVGPIAGLHAGLKASNSLYNYLIACDMPVISDDLIIYMRNILHSKPDIVACENIDFIEPFHAVYSKHLIKPIESQIKTGEYSLFKLMSMSNTKIIRDQLFRKISKTSVFTNLNTRPELERFQKEI